jgi:ribosome-associated translation inhibitor RaiA
MATDTQLIAAIDRLAESLDRHAGTMMDFLDARFESISTDLKNVVDAVATQDGYLIGIDMNLDKIEATLRRIQTNTRKG